MTKTTVVNLRKQPYDVYIGRAGKGQSGYFGNPFTLGPKATKEQRLECIQRYEAWFLEKLLDDVEFRRRIHELRGKKLGCFCKPAPCHGDVIADYLNDLEDANAAA